MAGNITRINNNQVTDAVSGNTQYGINAAVKVQNYTVTGGKLANNITYGSDMTITGNLTVNGNTTTVNTQIVDIADPIVLLASSQTGTPTVDIGLTGDRGSSSNVFIGWREANTEFITAYTSTGESNTTIAITSYANLHTGNLSTVGNTVVGGNLSIVGNIVGTANYSGNILTTGIVSAAGNIIANASSFFIGNGSQLTGVAASSAGFPVSAGTTNFSASSNGNISATIGGTSNVQVIATTGVYVTGVNSASGNITGGNLLTGGLISVTGNISSANINATGNIIPTANGTYTLGNATNQWKSLYVSGNTIYLGNIQLQQTTANTLAVVASDGSTPAAVTVSTASATGTVTGGNLATGGTISSTGNVTGGNVLTGGLISATSTITSAANITGANILTGGLISSTGTATVGNLATGGTASATGNITGGNILTAGLISATGTITSAANVTGANLLTSGLISATSTITSATTITGGNLATGGTASAAGNITGANILTAGLISATGNVYSGNLINSGSSSVTGNVTGGNVLTGGIVSATGNITAGNISTTGTANIGTLIVTGTQSLTGNISAGNLLTSGYVSATGNVTSGNVLTGGIVSATATITGGNLATGGTASATGNITGANLLTGGLVSASGNVTSGNLVTGGQVSATGNISTAGTVNTATVRGASGITISTGSGAINLSPTSGNIIVNNTYINGVSQPVQDNDVASKIYVDNLVSTQIAYHPPVVAATVSNSAVTTGGTVTYTQPNGVSNGIGAYLQTTGSWNLVDTANVQTANTRILIKNEANAAWNGVYGWANATTIIRTTDTDEYGPNSVEDLSLNDYFFVTSGNVNAGSAWVVNSPTGTITFGTSNITFAQFSSSQVYSANTAAGLSLIGTVFNAKVDGTTTAFDGGGNISVKASAQLTTPNIGAATGTSLSVTGNVTSGNV